MLRRIYVYAHLHKLLRQGMVSLRFLGILLVAFLITLMPVIPWAYGSSWPMFQYDSQNTGFNPNENIKPPLKFAWEKRPEKSIYERRTRPVIAGGVVYIGQYWGVYDWSTYIRTDGQLQAISLETGKPIWTKKELIVSGTPALSNGRVYFGTNDGKFYALDAGDGSIIWSFDAGGAPTSPAIIGHEVYFTTLNGKIYALNGETGVKRWSREGFLTLSAPAAAHNMLFVGGSEVFAIDSSTGAIKWSFKDGLRLHSIPVIKDGSVFVSCDNRLHCLNRDDGSVKWSLFTGDSRGSAKTPTVSKDTLYLGAVTAIDLNTRQIKWTFNSENSVRSASVAVANGFVFVGSSHNRVSALDRSDGRLYVLKEDSGELVWQYLAGSRLNDWYDIDPSPAVAQGTVVLNLSTSQLCCFSMPEQSPLPLNLSSSRGEFNPYEWENGQVDFNFKLNSSATVVAEILNYQGNPVRRLVDGEVFEEGEHSITWHGLIDFPEMADPGLKERFGDECILVAPDGDYKLLVTTKGKDGKTYTGSTDIKAKADI